MEGDTTKSPDNSKDKVQLVQFFGTVGWGVLWSQQTLQQVTQHLDMAVVSHRCDLLEASAHGLQTHRDVLVKEDGQVGPLRLDFTLVNPALSVPKRYQFHNLTDASTINYFFFCCKRKNIISFLFIFLEEKAIRDSYGIHPRSCGLMNKIPARDTVAGVAVLK